MFSEMRCRWNGHHYELVNPDDEVRTRYWRAPYVCIHCGSKIQINTGTIIGPHPSNSWKNCKRRKCVNAKMKRLGLKKVGYGI